MKNPIFDYRFDWQDIIFEISPDYSDIKITKNGETITVPFRALVDLKGLLDEQRDSDGPELEKHRLFNSFRTNISLPIADWE